MSKRKATILLLGKMKERIKLDLIFKFKIKTEGAHETKTQGDSGNKNLLYRYYQIHALVTPRLIFRAEGRPRASSLEIN